MKTMLVVLAVAFLTVHATAQASRAQSAASETYESADIDGNGNLRVVTSEQKTIIVPKAGAPTAGESFGNQTEFAQPVVSDDRHASVSGFK
jgi:hypothetical protein